MITRGRETVRLRLFGSGEGLREMLGRLGVLVGERDKADLAVIRVGRDFPNGWTVARRQIREGIPILLVASQAEVNLYREALQLGARDLLIEPVGEEELRQAILQALGPEEEALGKIITLFSTKGGVGKSTIAANLAAVLGKNGPVALADMDLALGNVASLFGVRPLVGVVDLVRNGPTAERLAEALTAVEGSSVKILGPADSPELAEVVEGDGKPDPSRNYVAEILGLLRESFPFTVVDTGVNFREATLTALDEADRILLVTTPDVPALQNTARALELLLKRLEYPREKVIVLLNRADAALGLSLADISEALAFPIGFRLPSDGIAAVRAANAGQILVRRRARSALGKAFSNLGSFILKETAEDRVSRG